MFIVHWACGSADDHGLAHTNLGIHGVYYNKEVAQAGLQECFKQIMEDIVGALDPDGEFPDLVENAEICTDGSLEDGFFEITYTVGTDPVSVKIVIEEVEE